MKLIKIIAVIIMICSGVPMILPNVKRIQKVSLKHVVKSIKIIATTGAIIFVKNMTLLLLLKNAVKEMGSYGVLRQAPNVTLLILNHKTKNVVRAKTSIGAKINALII